MPLCSCSSGPLTLDIGISHVRSDGLSVTVLPFPQNVFKYELRVTTELSAAKASRPIDGARQSR